MQAALDSILRRFIVLGRLTVHWPDGRVTTYAGPPGSGPDAAITLRDAATARRLVLNPAVAVGEAYMDGGLIPGEGGIYQTLDVLVMNLTANAAGHPIGRFRAALGQLKRRIDQYNPVHRAQRNVAHHYNLNGRLYSLFLDRDRQYSCAYFPRGDETLEQAQIAKKRHIAAKLCLDRPDLTVLDIGCGWGGLALTLAREYGARVLGITLSTEQLTEARGRAAAEGLGDRVSFELLDYRALDRTFDRVVSVGMFEHVGVGHYREFFDAVARCLNPDGVSLLHAIGRSDGPGFTNPWIAKYIFPGGYCPALSEVIPRVRAKRPDRHRHRGAPPALCRNPAPLAPPTHRQSRHHSVAIRRTILPHVRVLPMRLRDRLPPRGTHGLPDPTRPSPDRRAADARLHHGLRVGLRPSEIQRDEPRRLNQPTSPPPLAREEAGGGPAPLHWPQLSPISPLSP